MILNYAAPPKASRVAGGFAMASFVCGLGAMSVLATSLLSLPQLLHTAATFWPMLCFVGMGLATLAVERRCARTGWAVAGFLVNMGLLLLFAVHLGARIAWGP